MIKLPANSEELKKLFAKKVKVIGSCSNCGGKCCYNRLIYLTLDELDKIAEFTGLDPDEFAELEEVEGILKIRLKHKENGACIFLDEETGKCKIQDVKPFQCFSYPIIFVPDYIEVTGRQVGKYYFFSCEYGRLTYKIKENDLIELLEKRLLYLHNYYEWTLTHKNEILKRFKKRASKRHKEQLLTFSSP